MYKYHHKKHDKYNMTCKDHNFLTTELKQMKTNKISREDFKYFFLVKMSSDFKKDISKQMNSIQKLGMPR